MAGLTPEQSAQLQALINTRAPVAPVATGTWASPETAPIPAPMPAPAPAPGPEPVIAAPPADVAASPMVAPALPAPAAPEPVPAQEMAPPVDLPPAPPPAPPANFEEAQANTSQATAQYGQAVRDEGAAVARAKEAEAAVYDHQAAEQATAEQDYAREQADRQADADEVNNEIALLRERNSRLNKITDRRTTTQKVMGIIAQALSSVGDGLSRLGGNTHTDYAGAMATQLNAQIEQDIARQREAIEGRNQEVALKLTELGQAKTALKDGKDAEQFLTSQRQLRFATELKAQAARSGSELAAKEMLTAAAKLEADAARHQEMLQERLTEQKYRSRVVGGSGGGGGSINLASIRSKIENGEDLTAAEMKAASTAKLFSAQSEGVNLTDVRTKVERGDTLTPVELRAATAAGMFKKPGEEKADTADQAKARLLFTSSARPAAALEARMASNKFPATSQSLAEKLGIAPDEWNREAALFAQEVESVGNDLLRYESGASISTQETEGLIKRTRSTDPEIRRAAVQRLLDKRAALGQAFRQRPQPAEPKPQGGQVAATGGESLQKPDVASKYAKYKRQ